MKKISKTYIIEKQKEKVDPNKLDLIKLDIIKKFTIYFTEKEIKAFFCKVLKDFKIEVFSHESLYHHVLNYEKPIEEIEKIINPEFKKCVALLKKELKKIKTFVECNIIIVKHIEFSYVYSIDIYKDIIEIEFEEVNGRFTIDLENEGEQKELQSLKNAQEFIDGFKIYKLIDNKKGK